VEEGTVASMSLSDADLMYLLTLIRSSERPISTKELVDALKQRATT
jgi:hypothetical protein